MLSPKFVFLTFLLLKLCYEVSAMDCSFGGLVISCPTPLDGGNEIFCCKTSMSSSVEVCCNFEDYVKQNSGVIAGIIVGAIVFIIIVTLCCCCFCSCCLLARRRVQRGTVIYGPLREMSAPFPTSSYPVVHVNPAASQVTNPPPPYPSVNPAF